MASICKVVEINLAAPVVWDVVRDAGNLHLRVAPGLLTDCRLRDDGTERIVTFADGTVLPEKIVTVSDETMRLVWTASSPAWTHHNGAMQVVAVGERISTVTWTADVLPHKAADIIAPLMEAGLATMKAHLETATALTPGANAA